MKINLLFATLLTLALSVSAYAQTIDKAKLDQFFDRLAEKNKAMGSLVIAKDGNVLYSRSIGYSQINGTEKKPLTAASRYRIGSITKMFTAAMILQLVEEGKLKLTDPLDKFLPQVPNAQKITIVQILAHRSGIPNIKRDRNAQRNVNTMPMTKDEHLALIVKATPDFEPDTRFSYSNSGYFLLGLIIEKVTGKSYEAALQEKITTKIGLRDTYTATGNIDINKNESLTYFILPGSDWKQVAETHPSILFGSGAIVSTPADLTKFIQALFDGKIVSRESLDQIKTMRDGEGLGMVTFPFVGKTFYGHTGGADNYGAWVAYLPEEKLAVAYTTNAKVYPVKDIMSGVVDIYYNKPFQIPTFESVAVSPDVLDHYVGTYSIPGTPAKFVITRDKETLYAMPPGQSAVPLEATAQGTFKIDNGTAGGIVIEFDVAKNQMTIKRNGGERVFTKEN
ncbi:beta-lactamase family protein [Spirosoma sp. BT702]|uniref:Beta-lactamase family protein n=1 Tax=Spirosoma profusum TaxID=2771354 RepID=A0A926XTY0_9BACT|nr:serine hydrolase domain-containing protein [Spirosoma profusum]MBD2700087.1 beta-lactamase family protein [Spirosoma profusum]